MSNSISVIVPSYNGGEDLRRCLASLVAADPGPEEILVVLDGGLDDGEALERDFAVKVIRLEKRGGPARARNEGAQVAVGEILCFVDADVVVPADYFQALRPLFADNASLDGVIGSYDDEPVADNFIGQYRNLFHHYVHQHAKVEVESFWGACGAVRSNAFAAVGGFDESYTVPSIEDIELGYRLFKAGYTIRLEKGLQVKHLKRWTAANMMKTDFYCRALPWTKLIYESSGMVNNLNLDYSSRVSVGLIFGLVLCLLGSVLWPSSLSGAAACALLLFLVNIPLYFFFLRKRGLFFALGSLPWHWLYYLYSGVAFMVGSVEYWRGRGAKPREPATEPLEPVK